MRTRICFLLLLGLLCSCSNTRRLSPGERLYVGPKVNILDDEIKGARKNALVTDLAALVRPKPNSKQLGMRLKLMLYNRAGDTKKKKGIRQWIRNKVGEPPVLTATLHLDPNKALLVNLLQNRGFFNATVTARLDTENKKSMAVFDVVTGPRYTIRHTWFIKDSSRISRDIDSIFVGTLLTPGTPYGLDIIKGERVRIDQMLKEKGYYYFKPDYLVFIADTNIGNHSVNVYLKLKTNEIPALAENKYNINNIYIYADYKLKGDADDTGKENKVTTGDYAVIDKSDAFKAALFNRMMIFEKGDVYNLDDQNTSLSRLVNLGTFKFVKNRLTPVSDSLLDVYYYLTPYPKRAVTFELGGLTQSDNRLGTEGSISWKNRNAYKEAEELLLKFSGGFEAQYSGPVKEPNIYHFGAESDFTFPRFVVPFIKIQTDGRFLPHSIIKFKYNYESESDLMRINTYTASYGYDWKQSPRVEHQLYPLNFTYVKTDTLNPTAAALLYGNLVFDGIIIGPTYEFTFNSQGAGLPKKNAYFFDGLVDMAGNIQGMVEHADYRTHPELMLGSTYAQYVKLQPDFRYYRRISKFTTIATRAMAGIGIPYGNSEQLPNIKQFWAGGNSDLRGFPSRLVGPGTFNEYSADYFEALGDMKLECNAELRQALYKFIGLGLFADAGNIWLYHSNSLYPGGQFTTDFYKQLAADVGFGLRFDFSILLLRLDLGMPVRDPWLLPGDPWVLKDIRIEDPAWKKYNLVYNLAIGYPF